MDDSFCRENPMSDLESARNDLAFLRGLVDEDWRPGLWGFGAIYAAIGAVLSIHVALSWAAQQGVVALQGSSLAVAYVVLYGTFGVITWLIRGRGRRLFGVSAEGANAGASVKARAGAATLGGVFIAHLVIMVCFFIAARRLGDQRLMELLPVTLFALQGVAWIVVHSLRRQGWQAGLAWAWFAAALGVAFLFAGPWFAPFVACIACALMIVPGVHMMRTARRDA
jgi:hypothetical protein